MNYWDSGYFPPNYFPTAYYGSGTDVIPPDSYTPFYPPIEPYVLPRSTFEGLINAYGIDLSWSKSHACPCIYGGQQAGSADPACLTCGGRGIYWDTPSDTFRGLITFIHNSPTPDEPGSFMDTKVGLLTNGEPALTITYANPNVWSNAAIYDVFCEINSISRMSATLQVGGLTALPYPRVLSVAASGAVTVYNPDTHKVESPETYAFDGTSVTLSGYPQYTQYMVEFTAAPTYVAYRVAGAPAHTRPFGNVKEPRRFRLQSLDLWLRSRGGSQQSGGLVPS